MFKDNFNSESKLWVFQSDGEINEKAISKELSSFLANWQTHGRKVESASSVIAKRFLLVAVNEVDYAVSGCAIDELTKTIVKLGQSNNLNLQDRAGFYYKGKEGLEYAKFSDFKEMYLQGELKDGTEFYDASISINREFSSRWVSNIGDSWMKNRFL